MPTASQGILRRHRGVLILLLALHLPILLAGLVAPYPVALQNRELPFAPPSPLHWVDEAGKPHLRPFIYPRQESPSQPGTFLEDRSERFPIHFFVSTPDGRRLFGVEEPASIHLLGTDRYGRDLFSRLLYGARLSVVSGLLAATLALVIGALVGLVAGFYGGWVDRGAMAMVEVFIALPWLYLLVGARAFLPLDLDPAGATGVMIVLIGLLAWARPAGLVRGEAMAARHLDPLLAARGFGASDLHLLRHHVAPHSVATISTQWALLIPQCVLAEITLSFLGLGAPEPVPSLGTLLTPLMSYSTVVSRAFMFSPAFVLVGLILSYYLMAKALRQSLGTETTRSDGLT